MSAQQLPALIDRATCCLAEARTSAEVLEAKAAAEAALAYAKVTKAANETQANCLRMIVRAEMRMADEIDRGQANGEVATAGDNPIVRASDNQVTYEALGIDRRRVAEWRGIRDAGEQAVEQAIQNALAEGRAPTKGDVLQTSHAREILCSSESVEYYTAPHIVARVVEVMGAIDLDPSWHPDSPVRARTTYTAADDGLTKLWTGRVYINRPYGRGIDAWVEKLVADYESGAISEAIALVPANVGSQWFRRFDAYPRCFIRGRLKFANAESTPTFWSAVIYLGPNVARFAAAFGVIGGIWVRFNGGQP